VGLFGGSTGDRAPSRVVGMARPVWTGAGALSLLLAFAAPLLGWLVGWPPDPVVALLRLAALLVLTGAGAFAVGVRLNSTAGPRGRTWTARHTFGGVPMQRAALTMHAGLVLLTLAGAVGLATGSIAAFVGGLAVALALAIAVPALVRARGQTATTERRAVLAERGWQVWEADRDLPRRWEVQRFWREGRSRGAPAHGLPPYRGPAYGVVGGESAGLPFTAFDALVLGPTALTSRPVTTWVVHLPVVLPTTIADTPDSGPTRIRSRSPVLVRELIGAGLVDALTAAGFRRWRIEGWDLVCVGPGGAAPDELAATAEALTAAAAAVPGPVLRLHGRSTLPGVAAVDRALLESTGARALSRVPRPQ
jgi:hypothetical protein